MLCERCQKNQASVHMTSMVNNQRQERHLCAQCASQQGLVNINPALSLQEFLSGFFAAAEGGAAAEAGSTQTPSATVTACPRCGMNYQQFRQLGRLGCAACYDAFEWQLQPMLRRIHGTLQHTGKAPCGADDHRKQQQELHNLRAAMQDAITMENFERAAQLRDEIKCMEEAGKGADAVG